MPLTQTVRFVLFVAALMSSACGGDTPTSPTTTAPPAAPTVGSVQIAGANAVRAGFVSDFSATARLSDGTSPTVAPAWTSSNPAAATIDGNGRVTAISQGSTTLSAFHQGVVGTKSIQIVTNYGGTWSGTYAIRGCDQSGAFATARWCQSLGGVGARLPFSMVISQGGDDRSQVSGRLTLGTDVAGNVTGTVTNDGRLNVGGSFTVATVSLNFVFRIGGWDTRLEGQSGMAGRFAFNLSAIGLSGNAYQENEIVSMFRSSVADVTPAPTRYSVVSLPEFFDRIRSSR